MKQAIELKFPGKLSQLINLPTLHILFDRREDGTWRGHCLDFDTWAFSEQTSEDQAMDHVLTRLVEMAFTQYLYLHSEDLLDDLYANEVTEAENWLEFRRLMNQTRARKLKKSLSKILNSPDLLNAPEIKEFDLSHLPTNEIKQIEHWLTEIKNAAPSKRSEILLAMLRSLKDVVPLRVVSQAG